MRRQAEAVCAELGPGWTAEVHENMHWFAVCISPCKRWNIHLPSPGYPSYLAQLGEPGGVVGRWSGTDKTPIAATEAAWLKYVNAVDEMAQYRTSAPHLVCPVKVPRPAKKTRRKS